MLCWLFLNYSASLSLSHLQPPYNFLPLCMFQFIKLIPSSSAAPLSTWCLQCKALPQVCEVFCFLFSFFSKEIIEACTWLPVFNMKRLPWHGQSLRTNECRKFSLWSSPTPSYKPSFSQESSSKRITWFTSFSVLKAYFSRFFKNGYAEFASGIQSL